MTPHSICLWVYLAIREAHKNGPIIGTFSALDFNSRSKMNWKIQFSITTQCLKINEKVSFIRTSEVSYVYMFSRQKLVEMLKVRYFWVIFKQCIRDFSGIKCCVCLCCIDFYYYHTSELRGTFQWIIFHTSMEVSFGRVLAVLFAFVVSISFSYTRRNHSAGKLHTERDYMAIVLPLLKK